MRVFWLEKSTKRYVGEGNDTDIDLSVETHLESLTTDLEPPWEISDEGVSLGINIPKPVYRTGSAWEIREE